MSLDERKVKGQKCRKNIWSEAQTGWQKYIFSYMALNYLQNLSELLSEKGDKKSTCFT